MPYKEWDIVKISLTTNHTPYPQKIKEILIRDNKVRIVNTRVNGDCDVYIDGYGAFFVYADEILCPIIALFI
jgi:hypothetical protein